MSDSAVQPSKGTLFLTDRDVQAVFEWQGGAAALVRAYSAAARPDMFPPRSMARGEGLWLRTMTGVSAEGDFAGAKLIMACMKTGRASYLIPLFDQASAELVALLDGNSITGFRTAATTAIAADRLAPKGALNVAVIGSGFEAKNHLKALASIRQLDRVSVFSPNPKSRASFIRELADVGAEFIDADSAPNALKNATTVLCAARSRDETPTLLGDWLPEGATVLSIGSTLPEQREIDHVAIDRADLIVADMVAEVAHDTGDMIEATRAGVSFDHKLVPLADVVAGRHPGRRDVCSTVIYKSVGSAIQDLAIAAYCADRARMLGVGTPLPVTISPVQKGPTGRKG